MKHLKYLSKEPLILLVGLLMLVFNCANAQPPSVCDTVLTQKAFNTTEYSQTSRIMLKKRDDVCRSEYNSAQEAYSSAQQAGGSLGYGPWSVGLSDARQNSNGKYTVAESRFCKASAEELSSYTDTSFRQQVANIAVSAWLSCIKTFKNNQLYIRYSLNSDGSGLTGDIFRSFSEDNAHFGEVTGIAVNARESKGLSCKIDTQNIPINQKVTIQLVKTPTSFDCIKDPNAEMRVSLQTSLGNQGWIVLPAKSPAKKQQYQPIDSKPTAATYYFGRECTFENSTNTNARKFDDTDQTVVTHNSTTCPPGRDCEKSGGGDAGFDIPLRYYGHRVRIEFKYTVEKGSARVAVDIYGQGVLGFQGEERGINWTGRDFLIGQLPTDGRLKGIIRIKRDSQVRIHWAKIELLD